MSWWILSVVIAACTSAEPAGAGPSARPTPVEVAAAEPPTLSGSWTLSGNVRAAARATLSAQVAGRVLDVRAREGDAVQSGALLARIDPALAAARLESAEASVQQAEVEARVAANQLDRIDRVDAGVVADADRTAARGRKEAADAGVRAARATVGELREELSRHDVRAPWDGVIARRFLDPGDHASPGTPVIELVADAEVEVLVDGPPDLLRALRPGDPVTLAGGQQATVAGVVPALDPATRTVRVRVVPEARGDLLPGALVALTLPFTRTDGTAVVPADAVVTDPGGTSVVRIDGDGHARVPVDVVASSGDRVLVDAAGLAPGDRVITRGNERLRPGQPIEVRAASTASAE